MRPQSIVNFERVVLAGIGVGLLNTALTWNQTKTAAADVGMGQGSILGIQAVGIAITLLLLWFVARKASPVAKWIYAAFTLLGLLGGLTAIKTVAAAGAVAVILTIVGYLLSIAALWFLFRPDATAWFNDGRG